MGPSIEQQLFVAQEQEICRAQVTVQIGKQGAETLAILCKQPAAMQTDPAGWKAEPCQTNCTTWEEFCLAPCPGQGGLKKRMHHALMGAPACLLPSSPCAAAWWRSPAQCPPQGRASPPAAGCRPQSHTSSPPLQQTGRRPFLGQRRLQRQRRLVQWELRPGRAQARAAARVPTRVGQRQMHAWHPWMQLRCQCHTKKQCSLALARSCTCFLGWRQAQRTGWHA